MDNIWKYIVILCSIFKEAIIVFLIILSGFILQKKLVNLEYFFKTKNEDQDKIEKDICDNSESSEYIEFVQISIKSLIDVTNIYQSLFKKSLIINIILFGAVVYGLSLFNISKNYLSSYKHLLNNFLFQLSIIFILIPFILLSIFFILNSFKIFLNSFTITNDKNIFNILIYLLSTIFVFFIISYLLVEIVYMNICVNIFNSMFSKNNRITRKNNRITQKKRWIQNLRPKDIPIFFWLLICISLIIFSIVICFSGILSIMKQNTSNSKSYISYLIRVLFAGISLNGLNIREIKNFLDSKDFKNILIICKIIFGFFILSLMFQLLNPILSRFAALCFIYFICKYHIKNMISNLYE